MGPEARRGVGGSAVIFNIAEAPQAPMRGDRGNSILLFGPQNGAANADLHINVIAVGSARGPYHYHSEAENFYVVLEGTLEVCVEGNLYYLEKDDVAFIPRGIRHFAGNARDSLTPARVLEIYAPASHDFTIVEDPPNLTVTGREKPQRTGG